MSENNLLNTLPLGKPSLYQYNYDVSLLQAVPRSMHRQPLGLSGDALPFHGADIWTLYEMSWLNSKGVPQVAIGEVILDANSQKLIESKSFKLYLNSYNQTIFSDWGEVRETLEKDLHSCAEGDVSVALFRLQETEGKHVGRLNGFCIDEQDISVNHYQLNRDYLVSSTSQDVVEETLVSHLLKSNCLITNQPDWGSVQIRYSGPRINREALLRYLISFRQHNEFHEQCVERIFNDIQTFCCPEKLTVYARYTRRGGLDINPWRSNSPFVPCCSRLPRQ